MMLRELVRQFPHAKVRGPLNRPVAALAYDCRRVTPGTVYFAVPGRATEEQDYIPGAVDRGAAAVICERHGLVSPRATQVTVPDARAALARAAALFYRHPVGQLDLVGVLGTGAQAAVACLLRQLLDLAGRPSGLLSQLECRTGDRTLPPWSWSNEPLDFQAMLADAVRSGCSTCIVELPSDAAAAPCNEAVEFDSLAWIDLPEWHAAANGSGTAFLRGPLNGLVGAGQPRLKARGRRLLVQGETGDVVGGLNTTSVRVTSTTGRHQRLVATNLLCERGGSLLTLRIGAGVWRLHLPLIGRENAAYALAAAAVAVGVGTPIPAVVSALTRVQPIPGRLETIFQGQPFCVIVDAARSELSLQRVLATLRRMTPGRLLLVFGQPGTTDAARRERLGAIAARFADFSLFTSDNPGDQAPDRLTADLARGCETVRPQASGVELDRRQAIATLLAQARPGDTVLIAGKGHETFQDLRRTRLPFDDRVHAREALEALGHPVSGELGAL